MRAESGRCSINTGHVEIDWHREMRGRDEGNTGAGERQIAICSEGPGPRARGSGPGGPGPRPGTPGPGPRAPGPGPEPWPGAPARAWDPGFRARVRNPGNVITKTYC